MAYNLNDVLASESTGGNPISALYPPSKLEGNKSTITGFLEGSGIEAFTYEPAGYARLSVYKEIEGTDNKRSYSCIINDFVKGKDETLLARLKINMTHLTAFFKVFEPDADMSKFPEFTTFEDVVNGFNSVFTLPGVMKPEAAVKVVFRKTEGEKSQYNLSKHFPIAGIVGNNKMEFKPAEAYNPDITVFTKVEGSTDGMLEGISASDLSLPDASVTSLL